ncbi:MAG: ABC transporter ATP-binding protein [Methylobacteriaceae bacterium]|nr:ABC transporter ATP-binding protein [Methylobacteriaceae bacterium]
MSRIRVENVVKRWGQVFAVHDVSFQTRDTEFVALLGPSGCGKSTVLRLISGLETVTSGKIFIDDKEVTDTPPARRGLAMVFQSYALFPHLTVADNITFGLSVRGVPKPERARRLQKTAELLELLPLLDRRPSQLSGGQQQRVALGRALIAETPICLLDEPLSNLDAQLRAEMRYEIRSLQQRLGITMIFVTHDQTEAMSMADRIILMRAGKVEQIGAPIDFYEKPASTFAARFIGTPPMNVLDLAETGNGLIIDGAEPEVVAPRTGTALRMGMRPEDISFSQTGHAARVVSSEYFGADTITNCSIGSQTIFVRTPGFPHLATGQTVRLSWPPDKQHFFSKETGLRFEGVEPAS